MPDINSIFITGITGYIGGTVAVKLREQGYNVLGLARKPEDVGKLASLGIEAVVVNAD